MIPILNHDPFNPFPKYYIFKRALLNNDSCLMHELINERPDPTSHEIKSCQILNYHHPSSFYCLYYLD